MFFCRSGILAVAVLLVTDSRASAQWSRDFNDGTLQGLIEYDLTHIFAGIDEFAPANVSDAIRMQFRGMATSDDSAIMYDPQVFANTSALMLIRFSTNPSFIDQWWLLDINGGFILRFDPQTVSGYACLINDGGYLQIIKVAGGVPTFLCGLQDLPDFNPGLDWWLRAECKQVGTGGLLLRARGWPEGAPEPDFWHAECVDGDPLGAGAAGLLANEDDDGNGQYIDLDEVSVTVPDDEICDNGIDDDGDGFSDCNDSACFDTPVCHCNDPFADLDGDGDVDQFDFAEWQRCHTGPDDPGQVYDDIRCGCLDRDDQDGSGRFDRLLDGDEDVDLDDLDAFFACFSGPAVPADPACDD